MTTRVREETSTENATASGHRPEVISIAVDEHLTDTARATAQELAAIVPPCGASRVRYGAARPCLSLVAFLAMQTIAAAREGGEWSAGDPERRVYLECPTELSWLTRYVSLPSANKSLKATENRGVVEEFYWWMQLMFKQSCLPPRDYVIDNIRLLRADAVSSDNGTPTEDMAYLAYVCHSGAGATEVLMTQTGGFGSGIYVVLRPSHHPGSLATMQPNELLVFLRQYLELPQELTIDKGQVVQEVFWARFAMAAGKRKDGPLMCSLLGGSVVAAREAVCIVVPKMGPAETMVARPPSRSRWFEVRNAQWGKAWPFPAEGSRPSSSESFGGTGTRRTEDAHAKFANSLAQKLPEALRDSVAPLFLYVPRLPAPLPPEDLADLPPEDIAEMKQAYADELAAAKKKRENVFLRQRLALSEIAKAGPAAKLLGERVLALAFNSPDPGVRRLAAEAVRKICQLQKYSEFAATLPQLSRTESARLETLMKRLRKVGAENPNKEIEIDRIIDEILADGQKAIPFIMERVADPKEPLNVREKLCNALRFRSVPVVVGGRPGDDNAETISVTMAHPAVVDGLMWLPAKLIGDRSTEDLDEDTDNLNSVLYMTAMDILRHRDE